MDILFKDNELEFIYESLIIAIYCDEVKPGYWKDMDPLKFGSQEAYNKFINEGTKEFEEGKLRISSALGVLAYRFPDEKTSSEIRVFFDRLIYCDTQKQIAQFIEDLVVFVEKL
jgi:hypothetical protein